MAMTNRELDEMFRARLEKFERLAEHEHIRAKELPEPFRSDVEGFAKSLELFRTVAGNWATGLC